MEFQSDVGEFLKYSMRAMSYFELKTTNMKYCFAGTIDDG